MSEWVNAQARQLAFLAAFCPKEWKKIKKFILYGGAAGGGKSYIARKGAAKFCIDAYRQFGVKNCRVGLFCEDYPALKDRHLGKFREEFPTWMGELKDHRDVGLCFMFSEQFGNNYIALRNLDDPSKYDSSEFAAILVDEFTKNKQPDLFDQLRKRLRWPRKVADGGVFPDGFKHPFAALTNPGGPLHGLAKQYWIDRDFPKWLSPFADDFIFIPAKVADNIYNPVGYLEDLMSLAPELAKAYAEGSWDIFKGQYFKEWRNAYHICDWFEIPEYWKRGIAMDWGWTSPFCVLFFAISPDGDIYVYKEFYGTERLPEWIAERILDQIEIDGVSQADYVRVIDPATRQKDPRFGMPVREMLSDAGVNFEYANNDRLSGWVQVRKYLAWDRNAEDDTLELKNLLRRPKVQILRDPDDPNKSLAPNLARTMPIMISDDNRPEDVDTDLEDHAPDTLRYFLMTRPAPTKIPFRALKQEWQEAIARAQQREKERANVSSALRNGSLQPAALRSIQTRRVLERILAA